MSDMVNLADRLEAACDISGKPTGRHMIKGVNAISAALADSDDEQVLMLADAQGTLAECIANEAKLFDTLASVAMEAAAWIREAAAWIREAAGPPGALLLRMDDASVLEGAVFGLVGIKVEDAKPKDRAIALVYNVSDNAAAWNSPWVTGLWSEDAHGWFDLEGYPLTPAYVVKLPPREIFERTVP